MMDRWLRKQQLVNIAIACVMWASAGAQAAEQPAPASESVPTFEEVPHEERSPRAVVAAYLDLCRAGKFAKAARFLDVPKGKSVQGSRLARELKAVLDRRHWIDLDQISPQQTGNTDDGLPINLEQIAQIRGPSGHDEPVRLYRRASNPSDPEWVFSRATVERIDAWYGALEVRWALERLPSWLLRSGPKELLVWQWMALAVLLPLTWLIGAILSRVTRRVLARLAPRTTSTWDDALVQRIGGPFTALWTLASLYSAMPFLGLYQPAKVFLDNVLRGSAYFCGFWIVSRIIEVTGRIIGDSPWGTEHLAARALVPIAVRLGKIIVLVLAVIALISALGYPATSLIAGLGVGGLAIALAAQKTVENLFGAFTLGFDQPFRVGDFVKVEDFVGTVESIGLRSTKIRTLERTVVSIANGKLAEMRIENFGARDRMRLACTLGLVYSTTAEQVRQVLSGLEQVLREHPKIWSEAIVVRFKEFADSALLIEVMAWFLTTDYSEFQRIREEILLGFMQAVENANASFAFPTRTVHLVQGSTVITEPAHQRV